MVQATQSGLDPRALVRAEVDDPATADVIVSVAELLATMQRSRMLHHTGAPAVGVLIQLAKHGAMRPTALASALNIDLSTVSRQLTRLEAEGLVQRKEVPHDRRAHVVELTEPGLTHANEAIVTRIRGFQTLIARWSEDDRVMFARLLERFVNDFERQLTEGVNNL